MKKYFLLFAVGVSILTGCSNDDGVMNDTLSEGVDVGVRSALDKVFTVEKVADNLWLSDGNGGLCTDLDGNMYFSKGLDLMKYNLQTKEITVAFRLPNYPSSFCVDYQNNLYYTDYRLLYKISAVDGSITELTSRIPLPVWSTELAIRNMCVAENGNVFFGVSLENSIEAANSERVYKITPQGNITEIAAFSPYQYDAFVDLKATNLIKSKGSYVYVVQPGSSSYLKINTTNRVIESISANSKVEMIAAALGKDNPYALRGHDIVRLRPTQNSDLLIGTIPSYITVNGNLLVMKQPEALCMNADATVFYVVIYDSHPQNICYKLTLE